MKTKRHINLGLLPTAAHLGAAPAGADTLDAPGACALWRNNFHTIGDPSGWS